ncbi:branched-chain amino acid ABC transporter permease [Nocardioides acrostichi]|uniref:Branched-chain amino acid ABC transporter permease n=1 Tax=Nocardioides acrostichi TaxID=2784339 RepID=A0A930YDR8_9ACTN|nr:branched-chain amino acid ABC transporter permease [Nocardioides acrostichi]MBF4162729.1 branched-chain amino acid ABC transporter permease [Nocardioides acrostichi]
MALPITVHEGTMPHRGIRLGRVALVVAVVLALPYVVAPYRLDQVTGALILAIAAVGLNLLSGFGGQISLGHAAFFGFGAYTTGILVTDHGWYPPVAFVLGMLVCFVVGVLVGVPALRLRGMYLALVTLAVGVIFPSLVRRFDSLTGGSAGLFGISFDAPDHAYFAGRAGQILWLYYVAVVALAVSCLLVWNIMRGRTGRAIVALRDNEPAAIVMGVDRTVVRTVLFGISAAIAGLAGGLFAVDTGILTPDSFSLLFTIYLLVAMVLGGRASFWGPIIGGFVIYYLPLWTGELTDGPAAGVLFGILIIVMVFTLREGVVGGLGRLGARVLVVEPRRPTPRFDLSEAPPVSADQGIEPAACQPRQETAAGAPLAD